MNTKTIQLRADSEFLELLKQKAAALHLSKSALIRLAISTFEIKNGGEM
jgi:predicted transcriptional regulator